MEKLRRDPLEETHTKPIVFTLLSIFFALLSWAEAGGLPARPHWPYSDTGPAARYLARAAWLDDVTVGTSAVGERQAPRRARTRTGSSFIEVQNPIRTGFRVNKASPVREERLKSSSFAGVGERD